MSEVDHVVYDPDQVSLEQLVYWLKEAGTYIRTVSQSEDEKDKESLKN